MAEDVYLFLLYRNCVSVGNMCRSFFLCLALLTRKILILRIWFLPLGQNNKQQTGFYIFLILCQNVMIYKKIFSSRCTVQPVPNLTDIVQLRIPFIHAILHEHPCSSATFLVSETPVCRSMTPMNDWYNRSGRIISLAARISRQSLYSVYSSFPVAARIKLNPAPQTSKLKMGCFLL